MKKTIAVITALALFALIFPSFSACTVENAAKISRYEIEAEYDGAKKVTATHKTTYFNDTDGAVKRIYFHLYARAYESDAVFKATENVREYGKMTLDEVTASSAVEYETEGEDKDLLAVVPAEPVLPDESFTVTVKFTLELPECDYRLGVTGDKSVHLCDCFPVLCAEGDTSPYYEYGEPFVCDVADYFVTIKAPSDYEAVSGGAERVISDEKGVKTTSITQKGARSFGLCLLKKPKAEKIAESTVVRSRFSLQSLSERALKSAADAVSTFSRLFGSYPFDELEIVGSCGEQSFNCSGLYCVGEKTADGLFDDCVIFGAARQWWGGAVGFDNVNCAFMSEGLSEYSATLFYENNRLYNVKTADRLSDAGGAYALFVTEMKPKSTALMQRICNFGTRTEYLFCTRVKGELFFHSLRELVGDRAFFAALKRFFGDYSNRIASPDCFIAALERESGKNVSGYCYGWLNGEDLVKKP